jgi:hypothetical protein
MIFRLRLPLLLLALGCPLLRAAAADAAPAPSAALVQRAEKITARLGLPDAARAARVRDLIANQYRDLGAIHEGRDARLKAAREIAGADNAAADAAIQRVRESVTAAQDALHAQYLARLAAELTPAQIEQVKDGMTYGVLPLTYRVYQEMLPDLTEEQKSQILAWLTEAREQAMDASTSEEKHGWFGKYKGRINNYLSRAGIDMKQAEKDMLARKRAAQNEP